jgi:ribulose-5-phosphate 4-epimerase/fuculose-1-phosphate aldolase
MSHALPQLPSRRNEVSPEEWQTRVDLAAAYRLVALFKWDDLVFTHISARVPGRHDEFLINPYGLMFEEMTASSLVRIGLDRVHHPQRGPHRAP